MNLRFVSHNAVFFSLSDPNSSICQFVPLNATLASDLDEVRLAAPEIQSNDSKFHASNSTLSSIPLPTLIPGGSAQGYLKNAIRVGRLENGELIVGGDESDEEAEEGEVEEAGKDALMWGMVGGVVVRLEDLEDNSEEKLKVDFYQSEATVTVSLYVKGLSKEAVSVDFSPFSVSRPHLPSCALICADSHILFSKGRGPYAVELDHRWTFQRQDHPRPLQLPRLEHDGRAHALQGLCRRALAERRGQPTGPT